MKAFKGFTPHLTSVLGDHDKAHCTFRPGKTMTAEGSKTAVTGYHCCENPFECLAYYALDGQNRFWEVEALGDIDEDERERIACTKIRLVKELSLMEFAIEGMIYIFRHQQRANWQQSWENCTVAKDEAEATKEGSIAIARGERPKVRGVAGTVVGLILEKDGEIVAMKAIRGGTEGKWMTINEDREVYEFDEEETD